jgi:hypothetical protein
MGFYQDGGLKHISEIAIMLEVTEYEINSQESIINGSISISCILAALLAHDVK